MRLGATQVAVLRFGAVMCLLGAVVMIVVAVSVDTSSPGGDELTLVEDPSQIALPDLGLFGGEVVLYGSTESPGVPPRELDCRLVTRSGREQSRAKMSHLSVLTTSSVVAEGEELRPLFAVGSYVSDSVVECAAADSVAPLAVSRPSTFGTEGGLVRASAAGGAVVLLGVAVLGFVLFRPRRG